MVELIDFLTFYDMSRYFVGIFGICLLMNIIFGIFIPNDEIKVDKKTNVISNKTNILDIIGAIVFVSIAIFLGFLILINSKKFSIFINIISIPILTIIVFKFIIEPIIKLKEEKFDYEYSDYISNVTFVTIILYTLNLETYLSIFNISHLKVIIIVFLSIKLYLGLYCLFLNIYFILKNLAKIVIKKDYKIILNYVNTMYNKIYDNYYINNKNNLKYSKIYYFDKKRNVIFKILLIVFGIIIDIMHFLFMIFSTLIIMLIINPFKLLFLFLIRNFNKIKLSDEYRTMYLLTKLCIIITLITIYIFLIIKTDLFGDKIISIYEFIATAIIIPLILESLLSIKNNKR